MSEITFLQSAHTANVALAYTVSTCHTFLVLHPPELSYLNLLRVKKILCSAVNIVPSQRPSFSLSLSPQSVFPEKKQTPNIFWVGV